MKKINNIPEYAEGIVSDVAAILKDGDLMRIEDIIQELNDYAILEAQYNELLCSMKQ